MSWNYQVTIALQCGLNEDPQAYRKFALSSPKLKSLAIKFCGRWEADGHERYDYYFQDTAADDSEMEPLDMDEYWETFQLILHSSRTSLEMIRLPAFTLVTRMNLDWQVFPHVTYLELEFPFRHQATEQAIHQVLRRYDFAARFPNLRSVKMMEIPRSPKNSTTQILNILETWTGTATKKWTQL